MNSPIDSLPARIKGRIEPDVTGCWLWTGRLDRDGYGRVQMGDRDAMAHRVVRKLLAGPLSTGLQIDHLCRVRNCVNPEHLEEVTTQENSRRRNAARTHCKNGHELTTENVYLGSRSDETYVTRHCRACNREAARAYRNRRSA